MKITVFLGADHRGFALKEQIKTWLKDAGYALQDLGAYSLDPGDDYPDFGIAVAQEVARQPEGRRGIVFCGSGVGMAVAANKIKGIRASLATSREIAQASRNDDDLNILSIAADYTSLEGAKRIIEVFLNTPFSGEERHLRRINKIAKAEHGSYPSN
jgi:ribose 5-phosphate isomerase B